MLYRCTPSFVHPTIFTILYHNIRKSEQLRIRSDSFNTTKSFNLVLFAMAVNTHCESGFVMFSGKNGNWLYSSLCYNSITSHVYPAWCLIYSILLRANGGQYSDYIVIPWYYYEAIPVLYKFLFVDMTILILLWLNIESLYTLNYTTWVRLVECCVASTVFAIVLGALYCLQ